MCIFRLYLIVLDSQGEEINFREEDLTMTVIASVMYYNVMRNLMVSSLHTLRVIKSRKIRWAGHVARLGEKRGVYRILVGKPEGKRQLGRPRRRWEDNIKMDLHEVGCRGVDWIEPAQDRDRWRALLNAVLNLRIP